MNPATTILALVLLACLTTDRPWKAALVFVVLLLTVRAMEAKP